MDHFMNLNKIKFYWHKYYFLETNLIKFKVSIIKRNHTPNRPLRWFKKCAWGWLCNIDCLLWILIGADNTYIAYCPINDILLWYFYTITDSTCTLRKVQSLQASNIKKIIKIIGSNIDNSFNSINLSSTPSSNKVIINKDP